VEGWLKEQREDHGRTFRLQNLDALVQWVFDQNLLNELRVGLRELGVVIIDA
jgi:hypothetical protein